MAIDNDNYNNDEDDNDNNDDDDNLMRFQGRRGPAKLADNDNCNDNDDDDNNDKDTPSFLQRILKILDLKPRDTQDFLYGIACKT